MWSRSASMPFVAIRDPRIDPWDIVTLAAIAAAPQTDNGWTRVSPATLAEGTRTSESWMKKSLKRLEEAGWVRATRRKDPDTGADLPTERRVNWENDLPEGGHEVTPGGHDMTPVDEGTLLPDDFPTAELIAAAKAHPVYGKLPMDAVVADFRAYHQREGRPYKSWPKAWDAWLRRAPKDYDHERQENRPRSLRASASAQRDAGVARLRDALDDAAVRRARLIGG